MTATLFTTADGVRLAFRWWRAEPAARAVVVLVHGFGASKDDPTVAAVAGHLAGSGYDVLGYDSRGHHGAEGLCTLGDAEAFDVAAAVHTARAASDLPVVLVGASMGGIAVLRHAAGDPDLAGVVAVSTPAVWRMPRTWRALAATGLTQTAPGRVVAARWLGVRVHRGWSSPEPPVSLAGRIAVPLALVHGARDRFVLPDAATLLRAAATGPCELFLVRDMTHAYDPASHRPIADAVAWVLSTSARPAPPGQRRCAPPSPG